MLDALTDTGHNVKISDLLPKGGCVNIMEGTLSAGFEYPDLGLVVMTEGTGSCPAEENAGQEVQP